MADARDEAEEGDETPGTATVEVTLPAVLLARESSFFEAALSAGFKETSTRVINYNARSAEGARWPVFDRRRGGHAPGGASG
jgi:hypothetical protein